MVLESFTCGKRILSTSILLLVTALSMAGNISLPHKKVQKEAVKLFHTDLQFNLLSVSENEEGLDELMHQGDQVHVITAAEGILGYVISSRARGRYESFDYSVIFSKDLTVFGVLVTTYRSSHGGAICSKGWLKQFKGYQGEDIKLGKDIDSVTGATISASSLVTGIRRCYRIMKTLAAKEVIIQAFPTPYHPYAVSRS